MTSTIRALTVSEEMLSAKEGWNELVHSQCENPYFLSGFAEQFFQSRAKDGEKPFFLAYFVGQKIVGIAPIAVLSWKGVYRVARFLTYPDFDPDFVVQEEYRKDFLHNAVEFLLKKVGCNLIDISLPSQTKSLEILARSSESLGTYHMTRFTGGHSVLHVKGSWADFEKERGGNFRRYFGKVERKMELAGGWKVVLATKVDSEIETFKDILEIEKASWKEKYRTRRGLETDQSLLDLWIGACHSSLETGFKWQVAFLEIGGKKIAYSFWLEYKDKGLVCKTSFDNGYRKFYPGIYIVNVAVRELFNNPSIKQIDFMTDLPFQYRWKPKLTPRFRVTISKSPIPIALARILDNQFFLRVRSINSATSRILSFPFT